MEPETSKTKPLSKEETKGLLSLIERSKIINNKTTNAINNKIKVEEWRRIARVFNANIGTCRRTPQQLRLKWENLKKNSRRRSILIRMERIKAGGGPPGYIPPDDILDRVAALLASSGGCITGVRTSGGIEKELPKPDNGCRARNIALAEYYNVKRKLLEIKLENMLENEKLILENEKLRLEHEKLRLENEKLRLEHEKLRLEIWKLKGEDI